MIKYLFLGLVLFLVFSAGVAAANIISQRYTTMTGYYNSKTQMMCTYPLRSVPSICHIIDRYLLPADTPYCEWSPELPIPQCDIIVVQIDTKWKKFIIGKE